MGWSYAMNRSCGRKETIERLTAPSFWKQGCTVVAHRAIGNHLWILLEFEGVKSITLALMSSGGRDSGWGYKIIDEVCGPYHYDCPLSLLNQATHIEQENSIAWRAQVREFHAKKALLPRPETGMTVTFGGVNYRLHSPAGARLGWNVVKMGGDGGLFRMKAVQLAQALRDKATRLQTLIPAE